MKSTCITDDAEELAAEAKLRLIVRARLEGTCGKDKWTRTGKDGKTGALDITALGQLMAESRNASELRIAWASWHAIAPEMHADDMRHVQLGNEGARELRFAALGAMCRSEWPDQQDTEQAVGWFRAGGGLVQGQAVGWFRAGGGLVQGQALGWCRGRRWVGERAARELVSRPPGELVSRPLAGCRAGRQEGD